MEITSLSQLDLSKSYTYADYLTWKFSERVELFKGKILKMTPAPNLAHQRVSRIIGTLLVNFLAKKTCEVFYAPFDVRLENKKADELVKTVVQPDICVICDLTKLDQKGCNGAPEIVIEILSPGNSQKEMKAKFDLYQEAGVLEYWLVQPIDEVVWQYQLENGKFINHRPLIEGDFIESKVVEGIKIAVSDIFKQ